jgi:uncharacterized caspase-like protein
MLIGAAIVLQCALDACADAQTPVCAASPSVAILSIGISSYRSFWPDLKFADNDARSVAAAFAAQAGPGRLFSTISGGAPTVLIDAMATKAAIQKAVDALQQRRPGPDDYTIVFVAAQGGSIDSRNYLFLPYDADTISEDSVRQTAIDWGEFYSRLRSIDGHVLLFIDVCHSSSMDGSSAAAGLGATDDGDSDAYMRTLDRMQNDTDNDVSAVITFSSCGPGEVGHESDRARHGLFAAALLHALTSDAATEGGTGAITVCDVQNYLARVIPEMVRRMPAWDDKSEAQDPKVLCLDDSGSLPLAIAPQQESAALSP